MAPGPNGEPALTALPAAQEDVPLQGGIVTSEDSDALQELFVVRDKAVALQARDFELATEFNYLRDGNGFQFSRGFGGKVSLRYGLFDGVEVAATVPVASTYRRTLTPDTPLVEEHTYVGDLALQANVALRGESRRLPGLVGTFGVSFPTGPSPYAPGTLEPGRNPNDPLSYYLDATGHYGANAGLQAFKTFDPVVLFGGVGFDYPFEKEYGGVDIQPGWGINYNIGASFAASERTTFGYTLIGQYRDNLRVNGEEIPASGSEPVYSKFSLIHRIRPGFYLEPSVAVGMTEDAADSVVSIGTRVKF